MFIKVSVVFIMLTSIVLANNIDVKSIMHDVKWREDGISRFAEVTLKIIDKDGSYRERMVDYIEKDEGMKRSTILYVKSPRDVMRTTILLSNDSSSDTSTVSNIWLYIPILGKTKKLSNQNKNGNFVGSNFQYADLEWIILEDFSYRLLGEEEINGEKTYKIEAKAVNKDVVNKTSYSKKILWINPLYNLVVQADYYNKNDFYTKRLTVEKIKKIDGFWTVTEQTIENFLEEQTSIMSLNNVKYNKKISSKIFRRQSLGKKHRW